MREMRETETETERQRQSIFKRGKQKPFFISSAERQRHCDKDISIPRHTCTHAHTHTKTGQEDKVTNTRSNTCTYSDRSR